MIDSCRNKNKRIYRIYEEILFNVNEKITNVSLFVICIRVFCYLLFVSFLYYL